MLLSASNQFFVYNFFLERYVVYFCQNPINNKARHDTVAPSAPTFVSQNVTITTVIHPEDKQY